MKRIVLLIISFFFVFCSFSQESMIDLNGIFEGKYRMKGYVRYSWRPNTTQYSYYNQNEQSNAIMLKDAKSGKEEVFVTINQINDLFSKYKVAPNSAFSWLDINTIYFDRYKILVTKNKNAVSVEELPFDQFDKSIIDYSIKNRLFVTKNQENVFVRSKYNNYEPILLCPDTGKNIAFGKSVHRSEWGINEGQYFSSNGNFLAFYRMDESMVADYPLVDFSNLENTDVNFIKYPMAGENSHAVKLGIFDVVASAKAGKSIFHYIKTDINDGEFLTNVTFSPDETKIYITHLNREQNHLKLIEYDVVSGNKNRILIEESDSRFVEPQTRMLFLKNGNFIWQSDRDGWNHCYLYNNNGTMIKQITRGEWCVVDLLGLEPTEKILYFSSTKSSPIDRNIFAINLSNDAIYELTPESGTHTIKFSSDKSFFIDYFTDLNTPMVISLRSTNGKKNEILNRIENPYKNSNLGETKIFSIKNKEGIDLYCHITLPPQFDKNKKYPTLLYVYGGPHSQLVTNEFMCDGPFLQYMAQQGFIIFTLDNRGTSNRGADFEKCIHRQLGKLEMEDQMCGIEYLKSLPYVDSDKICVDGWSFGGFMTLSLISTYPNIFKSATCGGPVVDWRWYEVMYGERYMDTPQENPEGYQNSSILPKVKNIKTKLLIFHGGQDDTVVQKHSLSFMNQAIEDGFLFDYFVYPNHPHNVSGPDRIHLWKQIERFHKTHLNE